VIWPTLSILIALAVAAIVTTPNKPPERHHTYWCHLTVNAIIDGMPARYTMSLPCKYRTNTPVDV
jgi:hypothetical protein